MTEIKKTLQRVSELYREIYTLLSPIDMNAIESHEESTERYMWLCIVEDRRTAGNRCLPSSLIG